MQLFQLLTSPASWNACRAVQWLGYGLHLYAYGLAAVFMFVAWCFLEFQHSSEGF